MAKAFRFLELSSLLILPKVAGKSVYMVCLHGSELGLRHGNPHCILWQSLPFAIVHSNPAVKQTAPPSFCNLQFKS